MSDENWVLFEGRLAVPATSAAELMKTAVPIEQNYGKPMRVSHESVTMRLITAEEMAGMRARSKILPES